MNRPVHARRARLLRRAGTVGLVAATATLLSGSPRVGAQLPPLLPTTTTAPPEAPATTAPPETTTTSTPRGLEGILGSGTTTTAPPPPPEPAPEAAPGKAGIPGDGSGEGVAPPASAGEFPADLAALSRSVRRTPARNTRALVDALDALVELGLPKEEALRVGMGRFPVAGYATYSHDWWFPRFGPGWRLHLGTDLFAAGGTPIRAPAEGTVRLTRGGLGGISAYVVQSDGTYFYFAHLEDYAPGLADGHTVSTGDIIGYVGTSGNAAGGSAHLHFEFHPAPTKVITKGRGKARTTQVVTVAVKPGTTLPAIDPKAWLDRALQEATADVPRLVAHYQADPALIPAPAPAPPEAAAVLPADVAALDASLVTGQPVASRGDLVTARPPIAQVPLAALAFLLIVLVASLTPVYAPRRRLAGLEVPAVGAVGAVDSLDTVDALPRRRRRRRAGDPAAEGDPPEGRRRRARRSSRPEGRRRRRGRRSPPAPGAPDPAAKG